MSDPDEDFAAMFDAQTRTWAFFRPTGLSRSPRT